MGKPEMEFFDTELISWEPEEGVPGQFEKILSRDPDTGSYTRLVRTQPNLYGAIRQFDSVKGGFCHEDFWEEVYLISGTLIDVRNGATYGPGYYACRPPGMKHGPFISGTGTLALEVRTHR